MKHITALLAAILVICTLFCSCGDASTEAPETEDKLQTAEATTAAQEATTAPGKTYGVTWGGRTCKILGVYSSHEPSFEIDAETLNGDSLNDAVFKRNAEIEQTRGVVIEQTGDESIYSKFEVNVTSGAADYDIVFMYRDDMASAIVKNLFREIPADGYINFEEECYSNSTIESMKIKGKLYHMTSDFSLVDKNRIATLFYNRTLGENYGITDVISSVKDKTWTFERFYEYVVKTSVDKNGDSKMDYQNDQYGVTIGSNDECIGFWSGMGCQTVVIDGQGAYSFEYASDHSVSACEELQRVFENTSYFYASTTADNYAGAGDAFEDGRALFYGAVMSELADLSGSVSFAYTVLPYPMLNEAQGRYYSNTNNRYSASFGIPTCAADPDFSNFMIEVLSMASTATTLEIYYDLNCKTKNSYDSECAEMMTILFDNMTFDFGFMYDEALAAKGFGPKSIVSNAIRGTGTTLTKAAATFKKNAPKAIESLLEAIN